MILSHMLTLLIFTKWVTVFFSIFLLIPVSNPIKKLKKDKKIKKAVEIYLNKVLKLTKFSWELKFSWSSNFQGPRYFIYLYFRYNMPVCPYMHEL